MSLIIKIIFFLIFIEFLLIKYLEFLRKSFQWLIIKKLDINLRLPKDHILKFYKYSFDKNLGLPKPNSIKIDEVKTFGEKSKTKFKEVKYNFNKYCERYNPSFEKKKKIFTFGDFLYLPGM